MSSGSFPACLWADHKKSSFPFMLARWPTLRGCSLQACASASCLLKVALGFILLTLSASWLNHNFQRLPLVHRPVTVRHFVEAHDAIKYTAWIDPPLQYVGQKLLDVRANWCRSAT